MDTQNLPDFTPNQQLILEKLKIYFKRISASLAKTLGNITVDRVKYNLKKLQSMGLIEHHGLSRGGYWVFFELE